MVGSVVKAALKSFQAWVLAAVKSASKAFTPATNFSLRRESSAAVSAWPNQSCQVWVGLGMVSLPLVASVNQVFKAAFLAASLAPGTWAWVKALMRVVASVLAVVKSVAVLSAALVFRTAVKAW